MKKDLESNRSVCNKKHKKELEKAGKISCGFCRYHKGENANKSDKSWKSKRKQKYKGIIK